MTQLTKIRVALILFVLAMLYIGIQTGRGATLEAAIHLLASLVTPLALLVIAYLLLDLRVSFKARVTFERETEE